MKRRRDLRSRRLRPFGATSLGLLLAALAPACVVPIVQPVEGAELELAHFPPGSEAIELEVEPGLWLRGAFVPAHPGAPVILHLLPAEASVARGLEGVAGWRQTLARFQELGYASLALDYRGVGASDGRPDPGALAADGDAMWQEALRRTGGEPGRVLLRATSLGTVPAAELLESGAEPRGVVLVAPIRTSTIGEHAPVERHGSLLGTIVSWFLRDPPGPDLLEVLDRSAAPVLLIAANEDGYLPVEERAALFAVAERQGQRTLLYPGDHQQLVARAFGFVWTAAAGRLATDLLPAELAFLADLGAG